jgi:hypothetical protein
MLLIKAFLKTSQEERRYGMLFPRIIDYEGILSVISFTQAYILAVSGKCSACP